MSEKPTKGRDQFLNFERRLEQAKTSPDFEKIRKYTLNQHEVKGLIQSDIDIDLETLRNFLLWEQGTLKIEDDKS